MEASQHSLLAACFTLHSINATLAIVPQRGAGLWISFSAWFHNGEKLFKIHLISDVRAVKIFIPEFPQISCHL
jgi:hypothetical protein